MLWSPGLWCIYHVYSRLAFNYFASLMWFMMYLLDCLYTFDCLKINISTQSLPPNSWRYTLYRFFLSLTQKCVTNSKLVHLFEFNIEIGLKTCHIFSANKGIVSLYDVMSICVSAAPQNYKSLGLHAFTFTQKSKK